MVGRTSAEVPSVRFSPTSGLILVRTTDEAMGLCRTGEGIWQWSQDGVALAVFSPDGAVVWTLGTDGRVRSWRVSDGSLAASTLEQFSYPVAVLSPDGTRLLTGSSTGMLACWDITDVTGTR
jgi:WD40 repeat protein